MERSIAFRKFFAIEAEEKHIHPNSLVTWFWSGQHGRHSRGNARETALTNIKGTIDGVFAGNDVTALGVRDVILELQNKGALNLKNTVVVGYDGVNEVRELLKASNESVLINSVDVNLPEQVNSIVSLVSQNSSGRDRALRHKPEEKCEIKMPHLIRTVPGE